MKATTCWVCKKSDTEHKVKELFNDNKVHLAHYNCAYDEMLNNYLSEDNDYLSEDWEMDSSGTPSFDEGYNPYK